LTAGTTTRLLVLMTALCACLCAGACTPFAGAVSDAWPTWAGGMPKDVPPRPGAPGYEEFIAHQQHQDVAPNAAPNAAAAPGTTVVAAPTGGAPGTPGTTAVAVPAGTAAGTTAAVPPAVGRYTPPQAPLPPAYARPDDRNPTQGGLY
jgi:pilus assembly protein FimV